MADEANEQRRLARLKAAAEAEMRRPAPELTLSKRPRADGDAADSAEKIDGSGTAVDALPRFAYAGVEQLLHKQGAAAFLGLCGFERQASTLRELLNLLRPLLPDGAQLLPVKVNCRGLVMLLLQQSQQEASPPTATPSAMVAELLRRIDSGKLAHTRFCQRLVPADAACVMEAASLRGALSRVVDAFLACRRSRQQNLEGVGEPAPQQPEQHKEQQQQQQQQQEQEQEQEHDQERQVQLDQKQQLQFAVAFKSRCNEQLPTNGMPSAQQQQQQQQQEGADPGGETVLPEEQPSAMLLDRAAVIKIAADVVLERCALAGVHASVNLSAPELVVSVEALPLSGVLGAGVAALPATMCIAKPKLAVRPLADVSQQQQQLKRHTKKRHGGRNT